MEICFHIHMFVMHRGTLLHGAGSVQQCNTQIHCLHCIVLLRREQQTLNAHSNSFLSLRWIWIELEAVTYFSDWK